jgi:hypothetical protein
VEAANLWSREAEACQRAKRAEKELAALHQETTEAAQIKREHDQLCQAESWLCMEHDSSW